MTTIKEGARVVYAGVPNDTLSIGEQGRVLVATPDYCHVMWDRIATATIVATHDLTPLPSRAATNSVEEDLDDSLSFGSMVSVGIRETYDEAGEVGVLNSLSEAGHLSSLASVAEEAVAAVEASVRSDEAIRQAVSALEPEEAEGVYALATAVLLRDASGQGSE